MPVTKRMKCRKIRGRIPLSLHQLQMQTNFDGAGILNIKELKIMKTSNINVHDMLSVWSVEEVEKHIGEVPGVESVTLNYATGTATVRYDETRLEVADIKSAVRQKSYESFKPEDPAKPLVVEPPEEKDKPETKLPPDENPDATPPLPLAGKPTEDKAETPATPPIEKQPEEKAETPPDVKPQEEKDKTDTGKPATMDHSKMDHSKHGNAPMGMEGHDHNMMIADFKKRFYVVLILTIPIMLLSMMIQKFLGVDWQFTGSQYILFALSSVVFFYGGWPFLKGFVNEVKTKSPGMMILIGFAITVAYIYSVAIVFGLQGMDFFWELSTLILIMLLGHWIEMKSIAGASRELELLVKLMPSDAHMVMPDMVHDVKTETLKENDIILVKPGEKVAADGIILEGESYLNESMLTGESKPVKKIKGEKVIAGAINGNGSIKVTVSHAAKDSYLSQVIKLVEDAQKSKSKTQLLADTAAKWLTVIAIVAGISTFLFWYLTGQSLAFAMERMVTVIVICCPHALGLAVPLVVAKSTALSAKNGLLIKNRTAFENARKITTIVFDKTGTLTVGKFEVSKIVSLKKELNENEIIRLASALEQKSEHPIATGILQKVKDLKLAIPATENFNAITGKGVEATVEGKKILVVSPGYLKENNMAVPGDFKANDTETVVFVIINNDLAGYIALSDEIRPESAEAIKTLKQNKIKSILLTGDNNKVAKSVSETIGMDSFFGEVLPHQKLEKIKELQSKGEFVAMTGDGVNDAPALAIADVGIAVGSGSDIAAETAGIILVNSNPKDVVNLILFGKATYRKMIQNLIWATGYNVVALPLAAGVLYKQGILLSPAIAAVFMALSTVVVAINASMLKVKKNTNAKSKEEPKLEANAEPKPETKEEPKPKVNDE
ncbi:heavy metal translocating P-type ATPase [Chitinophagaceae bacterium IBVUCB2]|nr:heavy metal translocating P-type ATPase [Chitinophagaceae bacterium IBVUCB2]